MFTSSRRRAIAIACSTVCLAALLPCVVRGAAPAHDDAAKVDLAAIQPGRGVVFGTIELHWPHRPLLSKGPGSNDKVLEIRRLDKLAAGKFSDRADATLKVRIDQTKPFLLELKVGGYMITCLYHKDMLTGGPTGYCYPVETQFSVVEGELTYVGNVAIDMPPGVMSLQLNVHVVDERDKALGKLGPDYGEALAAATTRLAAGPAERDALNFTTEHFPRLMESAQKPEMVHSEEQAGAYTLTRFAVVGRTKDDWDVAFEILATPRVNEPRTPAQWLERYRAVSEPRCPSDWKVLQDAADSITFERSSPECPPFFAQQALYRVLYGQEQVFLMICTQRGTLDEQTRAECMATITSAAVARE
jgi:hypothetical protein